MEAISIFISAHFLSLVLLGLVGVLGLFLIYRGQKSYWILLYLLLWFPLENLVLRYTPIRYYSYVKYLPEILLYCTFFISWIRYVYREKKILPANPLNKWLLIFVGVCVVSFFLNEYRATVWVLGMRQILRFVTVFYVVMFENYDRLIKQKLIWLAGAMVLLQGALGIAQYAAGGWLDKYLFFSGEITVTEGARLPAIEQFWASGTRVFATMGRYDRLGSFLALGIAVLFPWLYVVKEKMKMWYWVALAICLVSLVLTYSRASWLSALGALVVIGIVVMRDHKVKKVFKIGGILLAIYLGIFVLVQGNIMDITDRPSQPISERIFEAVSWRSWMQSYEGYGRIFFIINTPLVVVARYPVFGVGPGNYGGGVAAALGNSDVYDRLKLPFGIQNVYGQIDNNWFSIWGETGTLGLVCWLIIYGLIIKEALFISGKSHDYFVRVLARGLIGATVGIVAVGFFGPYFEFRTLMFYYWMLVGIVLSSGHSSSSS